MYSNCNYPVEKDSSCYANADEPERLPRKVILKKGSTGLGFNIIGGEDNEGIYVSFLLAGGVADLSGGLRRGDQLLNVNGTDLRRASHSLAVATLKQSGDVVEIVCQYRPESYYQFEAKRQMMQEQFMELQQNTGTLKTTQKRTFFIRALFDYDPSKDSGLPCRGIGFNYGDILHVTNASDDEWWLAQKLTGDATGEDAVGVIPGKIRIERRERARMKNVKFLGKDLKNPEAVTSEKKRQLFGRKFLFTKSKERSKSDGSFVTSAPSKLAANDPSHEETVFHSYELVIRQELKYVRPVIILGFLKERFIEDLVAESPDRFSICVPYATRPKRDRESDGHERHSASSRDQMEQNIQDQVFIESGQYNDCVYGTSIQAVRDIAQQGKHCLLDASGNAIQRLHVNGFHPIVIFVKPRCIESILEWNKRMPADQARSLFELTLKQERDLKPFISAILTGDAVGDLYARVKETILRHSDPVVWVPPKDEHL